MSSSILESAKKLHGIGFGVHWIRPNSKVPVEGGWSKPTRDNFKTLKSKHQKGYNVGTKLGKASRLQVDEKNYYVAILDVDVKSTEEEDAQAARDWVNKHFKGLLKTAPITLSGRGNGSMHIWLRVSKPHDSQQLYSSPKMVEVFMPSAKPNAKQIKALGKKRVDEGWRLRPAFEIDFMCTGSQVVLPPSIHPDSGKAYRWKHEVSEANDLPDIAIKKKLSKIRSTKAKKESSSIPKDEGFKGLKITDPSTFDLELQLESDVYAMLVDGDGVEDRSSACLQVAVAMMRADFSAGDILGVLTNKEFYLGAVAYEHAQTTKRSRAAYWAYKYCVHKAQLNNDPNYVFEDFNEDEVEKLDEVTAKKQKKKLTDKKQTDWRMWLDRTNNHDVKTSLKNIVMILENDVAPNLVRRDMFGMRDTYGCNTPWGGKEGELLTDDDAVLIKSYLSKKWKVEPSVNIICEAFVILACKNTYHSVRDYLEGLEWDGVERVDNWLKNYVGAKGNEVYLQAVARKFLIAAIARVYRPGIKFDFMPIFEGDQGKGKSTVGLILAGADNFRDELPKLEDKDAALALQGNWFCEFGELAAMRRADIETMKAFVTRTVDKVRPPYGRRQIEIKRQCVFFGTTNNDQYLKDRTGNRRYWPIPTGLIKLKALKRDRDQLWAEALHLYQTTSEPLWLEDKVEKQAAEEEQSTRMVIDEHDVMKDKLVQWMERINRHYKNSGNKKELIRFRLAELFDTFNDSYGSAPLFEFKMDNWRLQQTARLLKELSFEQSKCKGYNYWTINVHTIRKMFEKFEGKNSPKTNAEIEVKNSIY